MLSAHRVMLTAATVAASVWVWWQHSHAVTPHAQPKPPPWDPPVTRLHLLLLRRTGACEDGHEARGVGRTWRPLHYSALWTDEVEEENDLLFTFPCDLIRHLLKGSFCNRGEEV